MWTVIVDLRLLEVFCAAVEARSFTAAADRLRMSQPAVSKQVRAFESWCGARLLERSHGGVKPTREGERVYVEGRRLLEEARSFQEEVSGLSAGNKRRLRISASYTIGEYLLPGWIDAFQHHVPEVVTELVVGNSEAVLKEFTSGAADLCFVESGNVWGPDSVPGLEREPVAGDRLALVVAPRHRWARREDVKAKELLSEPFISRESGSGDAGGRGARLPRGRASAARTRDGVGEHLLDKAGARGGARLRPALRLRRSGRALPRRTRLAGGWGVGSATNAGSHPSPSLPAVTAGGGIPGERTFKQPPVKVGTSRGGP